MSVVKGGGGVLQSGERWGVLVSEVCCGLFSLLRCSLLSAASCMQRMCSPGTMTRLRLRGCIFFLCCALSGGLS